MRGGFAYYLLQRTDPLEYFQPAVHAEREHSLLDGDLLNFCGARTLHDQLSERGRHVHHFVKTLSSFETSAIALLASPPSKNREVFHLGVERDLVHERLGSLGCAGFRIAKSHVREMHIAHRDSAPDLGTRDLCLVHLVCL